MTNGETKSRRSCTDRGTRNASSITTGSLDLHSAGRGARPTFACDLIRLKRFHSCVWRQSERRRGLARTESRAVARTRTTIKRPMSGIYRLARDLTAATQFEIISGRLRACVVRYSKMIHQDFHVSAAVRIMPVSRSS